jgi:hypothetical protein
MGAHVQVFQGKVRPEHAAALAEIRPRAIAEVQAVCPELLHAELVRMDAAPEGTTRG